MITIRVHGEHAAAVMQRLTQALTPTATSPVLETVAWKTLQNLVAATPKKWTGQTKKDWMVKPIPKGWQVTNNNLVMLYLEAGTVAHGPTNSTYLYIPLRSGAMIWREGLERGIDYILTRWVRGIRPHNIVERERPVARQSTLDAMTRHINTALSGL